MSDITIIPTKQWYDTASISETHRRLLAEGHHVSENALRGWVRQGILPAARIGRTCLIYYPNVLKLLHEGTGMPPEASDKRPPHIPPRIAI
ncbi:MAG: hypothetical protein DBX59_03815 [Bacillota bacterium]|uniref:hypothetical protein n=1 Tax=Agathobaculum desmolans TaxID=39484 RepID=UPI000D7A8548|nr:MAG: hypothetical protein DBX59_03815 [Bacillota bacterium]